MQRAICRSHKHLCLPSISSRAASSAADTWRTSLASFKRRRREKEAHRPLERPKLATKDAPRPPVTLDRRRRYILYESDKYLGVYKPAGLATAPQNDSTQTDKESWHAYLTLLGSQCGQPVETLRSIHRLDKTTSGVLLLAKGPVAARIMSRQFADGVISKEYIALAISFVRPSQTHEWMSLSGAVGQPARAAQTMYRILAVQKLPDCFLCLLSLRPQQGRKHQIRLHLASAQIYILGEHRYIRESKRQVMNALSKQFGLDAVHRILLHAHRVTFDEWVRGPTKARQERMTVTAPLRDLLSPRQLDQLPQDFHAALQFLETDEVHSQSTTASTK